MYLAWGTVLPAPASPRMTSAQGAQICRDLLAWSKVADNAGMQSQSTHWSTRPEPGYLPVPPPPRPDPSTEPAFATARQHATVPPRPPEGGEVLKGLGG